MSLSLVYAAKLKVRFSALGPLWPTAKRNAQNIMKPSLSFRKFQTLLIFKDCLLMFPLRYYPTLLQYLKIILVLTAHIQCSDHFYYTPALSSNIDEEQLSADFHKLQSARLGRKRCAVECAPLHTRLDLFMHVLIANRLSLLGIFK